MNNNFFQTTLSEKTGDWSMAFLHSHSFYEMYFLLSGKRQLLFEDKIAELEEGSVAVIPPFVMHKTEGGTFVRINVCFSAEAVSDVSRESMRKFSEYSSLRFSKEDFAKIKDVLMELLSLEENTERGNSENKRILVEYLIYLVGTRGTGERESDFVVEEKMPSTLLHILKYLNTNFQEKITLATLGEKFFLSEVTLCNYFKKYLGVTFLEYLSHLRITKAKELLLTTKKSMEEIAVAVGLGSANYFGLFFKKAVGLSPMQFRKL